MAVVVVAAAIVGCGGGSTPTNPTPNPAPQSGSVTLAVTSVTATTEYVPGTVPPAVAYWSTFTVQETGGRSGAMISAILVHLQNRNPPVTSAEKTYTVSERVTANGSKTYKFGIVVDSTSTTVLLNEVNFIVSYTDDNGVAGAFSTPSSTSISAPAPAPTPPPTFADFNGSWSGTFTGQSSGTLAFTVANGAITVTQPAQGDGILTLGEGAGDGSFTTRAASGSCTWSGPFLAGGARQSSASGLWRCGAVSGPWSAARGATPAPTPPPPTSSYFFANWTCNNSSQCIVVRGHPNGSAGPFCSVTACTAWNTANGVGTCTSQPSYPIYNAPPSGTCWK